MSNELINDITDTARWIAAYRAQESERKDAVFQDPLAKRLAGERGIEMVSATPHTKAMAFAMVIRTAAIDRLIEIGVSYGVDTVINLGTGLDTRPYRMRLPTDLNWIEVDFKHLIEYKNELLHAEKPICHLERISFDLFQDNERTKLFAQLGARTTKALIITEGVIGYLTNEQAALLSRDIFAIGAFHYWIQDYSQGRLRKNRQSKGLRKMLKNSPLRFDVEYPLVFFGQQGWKISENLFIMDEANLIGRPLPFMFPWRLLFYLFPNKMLKLANNTYGYVMFKRS